MELFDILAWFKAAAAGSTFQKYALFSEYFPIMLLKDDYLFLTENLMLFVSKRVFALISEPVSAKKLLKV